MLIYRSATREENARQLAVALDEQIADLESRRTATHDDWTELLLSAAELETALIDSRSDVSDSCDSLGDLLRAFSRDIATGFLQSWEAPQRDSRDLLRAIRPMTRSLARTIAPERVTCCTPEGYAHYAVYPEMYADAADRFLNACAPEDATVIGIRSIGTSLASVVAARLARAGVDVFDITVRPRGHPFDRQLELAPALERRLRDRIRGWFAVVDEGPGLSGSSFACVAARLVELGATPEQIVFMPSWEPDAANLNNERARRIWSMHRKFTGSFDRLWLTNGRMGREWGGEVTADLSAGAWRDLLLPDSCPRPPVQPQHEQRKYMVTRPGGDRLLVKFNGVGRYGRSRIAAAREAERAGYGPVVERAAGGFIATRFVDGEMCGEIDPARVGEYIAARPSAEHLPGATRHELHDMVTTNARALCGDGVLAGAERVLMHDNICRRRIVIDGRLQIHEWIRHGDRLVKVDNAAHHDDHFFPGCQDAGWDLAGASVELFPSADARTRLIASYAAATGDSHVGERLPYWMLVYLAFRAGYTRAAADSLGATQDGRMMMRLSERHAEQLRAALAT